MVDTADLRSTDDGFTVVEVLVAMMVFAIIALGVGYSTLTTMRMSSDARSREVAANLAASEIDTVRAIGDPFAVFDAKHDVTVSGTTYTVKRSAGWVSTTGTVGGCGTGTGTLQYKRVNVGVSWPAQFGAGTAAHADTVLAPRGRLADPTSGSVLVSVLGADGTGTSGVAVSITSGGAAVTSPISATDMDGCSYALKVPEGTYNVTLSRAGYLDQSQQAAPTASVSVVKGRTVSAAFSYARATSYTVRYAGGGTPAPALPDDLSVSWFGGTGLSVTRGAPSVVSLYPFPSGYTAVAGSVVTAGGSTVTCASLDPGSWAAGTIAGKRVAAGSRPVATAPDSIEVPMGQLTVAAAAAPPGAAPTATELRVRSTASTWAGDPGCATPRTFTYSSLAAGGAATVAVPYGSWTVEENVNGAWVGVPDTRLTVPTNAAGPTVTGPVITIDPRPLG
jgi:prepilin-type N-terminal cleavage/methylation domain-containing protein